MDSSRDPGVGPKILVSACLLGENTRYDGAHVHLDAPSLDRWLLADRIISFCPEVEGGCPIPRHPGEIIGGDGFSVLDGEARVITATGDDVSKQYLLGAQLALEVAQKHGISVALLKARSPSCGNKSIYDGTFSNELKPGVGVTTALLKKHGIRVFNEEEIGAAENYFGKTDSNIG